MLKNYRVLDLTDERGVFCGYVLAHLGADIVALEPPQGSPLRRAGPAAAGGNGLWWEAYGRGRTSLTLDLETEEGQARLLALAAEADMLIESFPPAEAARLGLEYERLAAANQGLIHVSITPFGRTGPRADWPATDLTVWAASGAHSLSGDRDRAPVRTSVPQSFLHAGADAAGAALLALQQRHESGLGQHVDVSAQQSSAQAALSAMLGVPNHSEMVFRREAGGLAGLFPIRMTWPCKNGFVAITMLFGPAFSEPNRRLLRWLHEEGHCSHEEAEEDWGVKMAAMVTDGVSPEPYFELCGKIEAFTLSRTREELFEEGLRREIYIAPTLDMAGLLQEAHFHSRDYWRTVNVGGKAAKVPGPFAKFSASPLAEPGAAPERDSFRGFRSARAPLPAPDPEAAGKKPLAGLKVLDFMWVIAGPLFTRVLADYGATVVKLESSVRMDPVRPSPPFRFDERTANHSAPFNNFNAGKLGMTIDPGNPVGREVILELVRWADVVTESFSPRAMMAWNLDYDTLKAVNPQLIMVSSCLMGQTGLRAQVPGYGNMAAAITGFYELTGWPDRSPAGPYLAYTDGVSPRFMLASLLAALERRRATGQGQHIDLSQAEAAVHLLAPAILHHQLSGESWQRMGNRDLALCPHGVFPAKGEDNWVAIACQDDNAWDALATLANIERRECYRTATGRREHEDLLERLIAGWTAAQEAESLAARLAGAGVAAYRVQNAPECAVDPQLAARAHFVSAGHTTLGEFVVENSRFRLSRTPAEVTRAGPDLGEHNVEVLTEMLGYDMDKVADTFASLALE